VIPYYDFTVLCGRRGEEEQDEAYRTGRSNLKWPNSKHNAKPFEFSEAVDIAPWHTARPHIRWDAEREFCFLAGRIMQAADDLGVSLRWGGNWDQDQDFYDSNKPFDLVHFELWRP
jgi:peptidoglycan L-alanyl-D-glutamate endopeptidase CwlK